MNKDNHTDFIGQTTPTTPASQPQETSLGKTPCSTSCKDDESPLLWFAMRATYRSEIQMRDMLQDKGMRCFVPMTVEAKIVGGRKKLVSKPAVASLIFVLAQKELLQSIKAREPRLQYYCKPASNGRRTPITVPNKQMEAFIRINESQDFDIQPIDHNFTPGTRVRVTAGPFQGMEGTYQRTKGHRQRRFVIAIEGLVSISSAEVAPNMVEPIES